MLIKHGTLFGGCTGLGQPEGDGDVGLLFTVYCMCCAFVGVDKKLHKMHCTYTKTIIIIIIGKDTISFMQGIYTYIP
jgi:hypothetical protein